MGETHVTPIAGLTIPFVPTETPIDGTTALRNSVVSTRGCTGERV